MTITIIGGTGPQGKGLAKRLALSGHNIIIGSRDKERAEECNHCETATTMKKRRQDNSAISHDNKICNHN